MSEHSTLTEAFFIGTDALFFLFGLMVFMNNFSSAKQLNNRVSDDVLQNTTVKVSIADADAVGYDINGVRRYDGMLLGEQVYTDILSGTEDAVYLDVYGNMEDLTQDAVPGMSGLDYYRNVNPAALQDLIDFDASYIREYHTDTQGHAASVVYRIQ